MFQNSPINDKVLGLLLLLIIAIAALLGGLTNYWLGFGIFFAFLPMAIFVALRDSEQLTIALLGYVFLLTLGLVASLAPNWLQEAGTVTNTSAALQVGWLIAIGAAIIVTGFVLLLIVSAAAAGWHQDQQVSFAQAFKYVLLSILGRRLFSLDVKDGKIQGADDEKEALEKYGGPGRLRVYPGQAVVLHKHGMTTRAVGPGTVMVSKREKVRIIVPLELSVGITEYENVLTRDRIRLTLKVAHGAQIETAAATQQRLLDMKNTPGHDRHTVQRLQNIVNSGNMIGEPPNNFYVGIAEMIAKTPAEATKGKVEIALRDVFMSLNLEDLFALDNITDSTIDQDRLNQRRIAKIEQFIITKLKEDVKKDALVFLFVDINEIRFPDNIVKNTEEEAVSAIKARMRVIEAKAKEEASKFEADAKVVLARADTHVAEEQALAMRTLAREKHRIDTMKEDMKIRAKTEYFRRTLALLKDNGYDDEETIRTVMASLASAASLEDEFKRLMQLVESSRVQQVKQEVSQRLPELALERNTPFQ